MSKKLPVGIQVYGLRDLLENTPENFKNVMKKVKDMKGNPLLLFVNEWSVGMTIDRNKGLILTEFGRN